MGAVTDIVKRQVPASYRALVGVTNSYYNLTELQMLAEAVQFRLFATVPGAANEATVWNRTEIELLGTVTSLHFIPAAIDYWGDQLQSQATSGTSEDVSYFDRRPELWKVYQILAARAAELSEETGINIKKIRAAIPRVSYGDNGRGILVTGDPQDFGSAWSTSDHPYLTWSTP